MRGAAAREQLKPEHAGLNDIKNSISACDEARRATVVAAGQALLVVDNALLRSGDTFVKRWNPRISPFAVAATLPFAAFLFVAAIGSVVRPTPLANLLACGFLCIFPIAAFLIAWRQKARARGIAMVGVASAFALFTAAYLLAFSANPMSIVIDKEPIAFLGEAAFLAVTISVGGGTIGPDLAGAARVIAFIQLLLTVTVVASALTWGWRRLVSRQKPEPRERM